MRHEREATTTSARLPPAEPVAVRRAGWEGQFGRGYAAGFGVLFALVAGSGAVAVWRRSAAALAVCVAAFGAMFVFGIAYHAARGIGFPSGNLRRPHVLLRQRNPVGYWAFTAAALALAGAVVALGGWMWFHADAVSRFIRW